MERPHAISGEHLLRDLLQFANHLFFRHGHQQDDHPIRLCQNSRHEGEASHANHSGPDLYGSHHSYQLGKPVLMDAPALRE
jgi:hypothetical protein